MINVTFNVSAASESECRKEITLAPLNVYIFTHVVALEIYLKVPLCSNGALPRNQMWQYHTCNVTLWPCVNFHCAGPIPKKQHHSLTCSKGRNLALMKSKSLKCLHFCYPLRSADKQGRKKKTVKMDSFSQKRKKFSPTLISIDVQQYRTCWRLHLFCVPVWIHKSLWSGNGYFKGLFRSAWRYTIEITHVNCMYSGSDDVTCHCHYN